MASKKGYTPAQEAAVIEALRNYGWNVPKDRVRPMHQGEWRDHAIELIAKYRRVDRMISEDWIALKNLIETLCRKELDQGWEGYADHHQKNSGEYLEAGEWLKLESGNVPVA